MKVGGGARARVRAARAGALSSTIAIWPKTRLRLVSSRIKKGTQGSEQPLSLHKKEKVCLI